MCISCLPLRMQIQKTLHTFSGNTWLFVHLENLRLSLPIEVHNLQASSCQHIFIYLTRNLAWAQLIILKQMGKLKERIVFLNATYACMFPTIHDWDLLLPAAAFACNNSMHSSISNTPFYLDNGRHPRMPFMLSLIINLITQIPQHLTLQSISRKT